jgi:hypothetical protein
MPRCFTHPHAPQAARNQCKRTLAQGLAASPTQTRRRRRGISVNGGMPNASLLHPPALAEGGEESV